MTASARPACSPSDWNEEGIFRAAYLALFDEDDRAIHVSRWMFVLSFRPSVPAMTWNPLWLDEGKGLSLPVSDRQEVWIVGPPTVPEVTRATYDAEGRHFVTEGGERVPEHQVTHWCDWPADKRPGPPKLDTSK